MLNYSFYPQTGFSFNCYFIPTNNFFSGELLFLNSGIDNKIQFISGKINNRYGEFVTSYNAPQLVNYTSISGNMSYNNFNYYIDNNLIYLETGNFGFCSGVQLHISNSESVKDFNIKIHGDKPSLEVYNDNLILSSDPSFNFYISGLNSNLEKFLIYEMHIGGSLSRSYGRTNYVPREYFEISGQNIWEDGLSVAPGGVLGFTVNKIKNIYTPDDKNNYTYIPLYMETSFGTFYFVIFVKILNASNIQKMYTYNTNSSIDENGIALFSTRVLFNPMSEPLKKFFIYISGLDGNNFYKNNRYDTFTGSWGISFGEIDFHPQIIENENINFFKNIDNFNTLTKSGFYYDFVLDDNSNISGLSGLLNENLINSGLYNGIVFSTPYQHNINYSITGINFGIYATGIFTGEKTQEINDKISRGEVDISIYELDNDYKFKSLVGSKNIKLTNIYNTGNDNINKFSVTGNYNLYTDKKYALFVSGYSSGYAYGYNLFLSTGNFNYENNYINYIASISGFSNDFLSGERVTTRLEKNPSFQIFGKTITDNNLLSGIGDVNFQRENGTFGSVNMNIFKEYINNNENNYTGSAFLYISGYSGFEKTGHMSVYKDMFRNIKVDINID